MATVQWIEEMFAAVNAHDGERVAAFFAPDGAWEDVSIGFRHEGRAPIVQMWSVETPAFSSDARIDLVSVVIDETGYGIQWRWSGTHNDSGRRYDVRGASIGRLRDGLIVENLDYWNPAHMSDQIGGKIG
jgi:ketosteroid isomerase-like protein